MGRNKIKHTDIESAEAANIISIIKSSGYMQKFIALKTNIDCSSLCLTLSGDRVMSQNHKTALKKFILEYVK